MRFTGVQDRKEAISCSCTGFQKPFPIFLKDSEDIRRIKDLMTMGQYQIIQLIKSMNDEDVPAIKRNIEERLGDDVTMTFRDNIRRACRNGFLIFKNYRDTCLVKESVSDKQYYHSYETREYFVTEAGLKYLKQCEKAWEKEDW